jgi:hypothetical protein
VRRNLVIASSDIGAASKFRTCAGCRIRRSEACLEGDADFCEPCVLQQNFQAACCETCRKVVRLGSADDLDAAGERRCFACAPRTTPAKYTICLMEKDAFSFPARSRKASLVICPCQDWGAQLSACSKLIADWGQFATNSSGRFERFRKNRRCQCNVCSQSLPADAFDGGVPRNCCCCSGKIVGLACADLG